MSTLTIRNLPLEVIKRLKERAKRHGRSMEQEAREILGQRLAARDELLSNIKTRWTDMRNPPSAVDVDVWIAAGRRGEK